jgi:hypothetical protein
VIGSAGAVSAELGADIFFSDRGNPDAAADWLINSVLPKRKSITKRARAAGVAHFSLDAAVRAYQEGIGRVGRAGKAISGSPALVAPQ